MNNRLPVIVIIVVILLGLAYASFFVVPAGKQAIVLRFGEIVDAVPGFGPGLRKLAFQALFRFLQQVERAVQAAGPLCDDVFHHAVGGEQGAFEDADAGLRQDPVRQIFQIAVQRHGVVA